MGEVETNKINIILFQKIEVNKRNPTTQNRKTKRLYKILPCNLLTKIYRENPRKDNRERVIENKIRKKIAPIFRINRY